VHEAGTPTPASIAQAVAASSRGRLADAIQASPVVLARAAAIEGAFGAALASKPPSQHAMPLSAAGVKVHRNPAQPDEGTDIHIAPGQEKHPPYDAWRVAQPARGRVKPTLQMKGGVPVNDDTGLEHEADVMGAKALGGAAQLAQPSALSRATLSAAPAADVADIASLLTGSIHADANSPFAQAHADRGDPVVQRAWIDTGDDEMKWDKLRGGLRWYYSKSSRAMRFVDETSKSPQPRGQDAAPKSYRAWIKLWETKKWLAPAKATALSFSAYSQRIIETYPPNAYEYVGIGASCDLVLTYLGKKYGLKSSSIPLSKVTNVSQDRGEWGKEANQKVKDYILAFVPQEIIMGEKKILLMDVTSGGNTLNVVGDLLREILTDRKRDPKNVASLSLNSTIKPGREIFVSKDDKPFPSRDMVESSKVKNRPLSNEERREGVVRGLTAADESTEFDDDEINELKKLKEEQKKVNKKKEKESNGAVTKSNISALRKLRSKLKKAEGGRKVYDPKGYDRFITDEDKIEQILDSQVLKKELGRRHREVKAADVMTGGTNAEAEKKQKPEENRLDEKTDELLGLGVDEDD
jgi:hypothetical protein